MDLGWAIIEALMGGIRRRAQYVICRLAGLATFALPVRCQPQSLHETIRAT